jgi:hypothetical protein
MNAAKFQINCLNATFNPLAPLRLRLCRRTFSGFMIETAAVALLISILASTLLVPLFLSTQRVADMYFAEDRMFLPAAFKGTHPYYPNITVAPLDFGKNELYFLDYTTYPSEFFVLQGVVVTGMLLPPFLISVGISKLDNRGLFLTTLLFAVYMAMLQKSNATEYIMLAKGEDNSIIILINLLLYLTYHFFAFGLSLSLSTEDSQRKAKWRAAWCIFKFEVSDARKICK